MERLDGRAAKSEEQQRSIECDKICAIQHVNPSILLESSLKLDNRLARYQGTESEHRNHIHEYYVRRSCTLHSLLACCFCRECIRNDAGLEGLRGRPNCSVPRKHSEHDMQFDSNQPTGATDLLAEIASYLLPHHETYVGRAQ